MNRTPPRTRREVLRGVTGLTLGSALSGCLSNRDDTEFRIGYIEGLNRTTESHDVSVRVSVGEETVYDETHRVGAADSSKSGFVVDEALPDASRSFQVEVRLDGGDWETTLVPDHVDASCVDLLYLIERPSDRIQDPLSSFVSGCGSEQ